MDFDALNSPIGYSKVPLRYNNIPSEQNSDRGSQLREDQPFNFDFFNSPIEIIERVFDYLSQFEILSLCRTCSDLYELCSPRLFHHIVIDPKFNIFAHEYQTAGRTYINSSYNLKRFLRRITDKSAQGSIISSILCKSLPEGFDFHQFRDHFIHLFSCLNHVQSLTWLDKHFELELLYVLPQKDLITTLILNLESCCVEDLGMDQISKLNFPNLVNFQIKPVRVARDLSPIVDGLLVNSNDEIRVSDRLRVLSFDIQGSRRPIMEIIFRQSRLGRLSNLTSLSINDILLTQEEIHLLFTYVDLSKLEFFQMKRASILEYDSGTDSFEEDSELESFHEESESGPFLLRIATKFERLCHLSLQIDEHPDKVVIDEFISILPQLTSLDIVSTTGRPVELAQAIAKHHNLTKLSSEVYEFNEDIMDSELSDPPFEFYSFLSSLNLTSLRINNTSNMRGLVHLISSQKQLRFLEIIGAKAGGAPNLGLGMVHPTVFDEWFKVQHVVLFYLNINPTIEYIRVNDCIFECKPDKTVNPRDGLGDWFDENVKVC
ncbi:hypothetical protein I9W82_000031 [Candida metapsilosis]|uniref:F-box domain-containing protein n=1 Tax=Candida metapsilosis TaxID=273372 RepID=A0A8H7ZIY2_9ASCO|nr:hypothetical protein I9W82_000031 [Candida metapsilosis]